VCGVVHFVELFCTWCSISTPGNLRAKLDASAGHFAFGIFLHAVSQSAANSSLMNAGRRARGRGAPTIAASSADTKKSPGREVTEAEGL
jgi:hypothetical protein